MISDHDQAIAALKELNQEFATLVERHNAVGHAVAHGSAQEVGEAITAYIDQSTAVHSQQITALHEIYKACLR